MAIWLNQLGTGTGIDCGMICSASVAAADNFTVAAWVYPTSWTGGAGAITTGGGGITTAWMVFCGGGPETETVGLNAPWMLCIISSSRVIGLDWEDRSTGLNHPVSGATALVLNQWQHLCVTYNGTSGTSSIYYNGNLDSIATNTGAGNVKFPDTSSRQKIGIGCTITSAGVKTGTFVGYIADCALWKTDLTSADIAQLGKSNMKGMAYQVQPKYLHLYYPLDEVQTGYNGPTTPGFYKNRTWVSASGTAVGNMIGVGESHNSYL